MRKGEENLLYQNIGTKGGNCERLQQKHNHHIIYIYIYIYMTGLLA